MKFDTDKLLDWVKSKIEISTFVPIVLAAVTFVGRCYYGGYYDFYALSSEEIDSSIWDNITISFAIAVFSGLLGCLVYYSHGRLDRRFSTILSQNVPLFVIVFLVTVVAVQIYWANVEEVSSWLSNLIGNANLREGSRRVAGRVESFLRWMIVIAPLPVASVVAIFSSVRGFSFSEFLMSRTFYVRLFVLVLYLGLVLYFCRISGHVTAFGEFVGLLEKPDVVVTLHDGSEFQPGKPLYLIARSATVSYVSERASGQSSSVCSWVIPHASIKFIQTKPRSSEWKVLLDYFRR